ncbi:hypothetical protein Ahy_A01g003796 isoform B [Arachis hypogaea]|uniref:Uncharacterized protein n=1 Tax=Arachis hypogaea TaxID=3818 RepID=A0A445EU41_ARAHY|nr:hypothetical protein Ahy_A01g003796 isoform B [Arachis hypogaea]
MYTLQKQRRFVSILRISPPNRTPDTIMIFGLLSGAELATEYYIITVIADSISKRSPGTIMWTKKSLSLNATSFTPPPPTKATLSSFPLPKTHYTSSSSCSSTSRRFRVRAYNTSKFGNFLNLKPAHQPEPLDFDLPWCHPSDRSCFDVIIIGSGPAGTRLAEQVSRYGIKVCCVDPDPLSMWPNNYGVWVDE